MNRLRSSKPVVLGLGNPLFRDEGLGIHVIWQLMAGDWGNRAHLVDGGTDGLALLGIVEEARYLIVVDAIDGGYPPGTVKRLHGKEIDFLTQATLSVHQVGFQEVLALARIRGRCPENMVLIGVQPQNLEWGTQLSYEVNRRIPKVIAMIYQQIEAWAKTSVDAG